MMLTPGQRTVLSAIFRLSNADPAVPVTISAIHHSFTDMDVSVLVRHLGVLFELGLIENARPGQEQMGNTCRITAAGVAYCSGIAEGKS
jgi:hypothetical protein